MTRVEIRNLIWEFLDELTNNTDECSENKCQAEALLKCLEIKGVKLEQGE